MHYLTLVLVYSRFFIYALLLQCPALLVYQMAASNGLLALNFHAQPMLHLGDRS